MQNDFNPQRGAIRSASRPPVERPVAMRRPVATPPQPASQLPPPLPVQSIMTSVPLQQPVASPSPVQVHDITMVAKPLPQPIQPASAPIVPVVPSPPPTTLESAPKNPQQVTGKKKSLWKRLFGKPPIAIIAALLILGATGYVGVDAWLTNNKLKAQMTTPVAAAQSNKEHQQEREGTDVAPLPVNTLASYKVTADAPRALSIEKLGVAARVMPMGINKDGSMQAPVNINDSGWYTGSSKPGTVGAMVIDGHSSATNSAEHLGLFNTLGKLENGDVITVEKGDGTELSYRVVFKETLKLDEVDMKKVMLPYGTATEGLNLITCAGQWNAKNTTLDHRTIVYTERITS